MNDHLEKARRLRYIDLFCGIGGFRYAMQNASKRNRIQSKCVFSSDIDAEARKSYFANFGDFPSGDITKIDAADIPDHDLLFAGFPCQPFSIIGKGKGFADIRGTLFFNIAKIIETKRPEAFVIENVKQLVNHDQGRTLHTILSVLKNLGYHVQYRVLNALHYGLPQKRERVFIVGYSNNIDYQFPLPNKKITEISKILEKDVPRKYYASEKILMKRKQKHTSQYAISVWHENKGGNVSSYPYSCALRANASYNYLLVNGERRFTPRELLRIQGFPESFKIVVSDMQIRKQTGNAVPVKVIEAVLNNLLISLIGYFPNESNTAHTKNKSKDLCHV